MAEFKQLPDGARAYFTANQASIDILESITPVDAALAVPYIQIYRINPSTGAPFFANKENDKIPVSPLSFTFAAPPKFGAANDQYLKERPDVSLKSLTVKVQQHRNIITSQYIELEFAVHRPQALFDEIGRAHV